MFMVMYNGVCVGGDFTAAEIRSVPGEQSIHSSTRGLGCTTARPFTEVSYTFQKSMQCSSTHANSSIITHVHHMHSRCHYYHIKPPYIPHFPTCVRPPNSFDTIAFSARKY